jgi:hypothetical protein
MRFYTRYLKTFSGQWKFDVFVTFKPVEYPHIKHNNSPSLKFFLNNSEFPNQGHGIGWSHKDIKYWIAPFGSQPEFEKILSDPHTMEKYQRQREMIRNIFKPFNIDNIMKDKLFHYIGYIPNYKHHQIYFYDSCNNILNSNTNTIEELATLKSSYFGSSITLDDENKIVQENKYALRVPFDDPELQKLITKENAHLPVIPNNSYINVGYRFNGQNKHPSISFSWLVHDSRPRIFNYV